MKDIVIILFLISAQISYSQTIQRASLNTGGNAVTISGVSISASLGQPFSAFLPSSVINLYSGFQQPYNKISASTHSLNNLNRIHVYPNPFTREINLTNISNILPERTSLYDITGQRITLSSVIKNGDHITIYLDELSSGMYTLQVEDKNQNITIFKLIK